MKSFLYVPSFQIWRLNWQLTGLDTENSPVFNENFKNMVLIFIHWAGSNSKLTTPLYTYDFFVGVKRKGFQAAVSDQGLLMFDCALDIIRTRGSIMRDRSLNLTVLRQHGRTISTGPWEPSLNVSLRWSFPPSGGQGYRELEKSSSAHYRGCTSLTSLALLQHLRGDNNSNSGIPL